MDIDNTLVTVPDWPKIDLGVDGTKILDGISRRTLKSSNPDCRFFAKLIYRYREDEVQSVPVIACDFRDIETSISIYSHVNVFPTFTGDTLDELLEKIEDTCYPITCVFLTIILPANHGKLDERLRFDSLYERFGAEKILMNLWYASNDKLPYMASVMTIEGERRKMKSHRKAAGAIEKALSGSAFQNRFSRNGKYTYAIDNYDVDGVQPYTFLNRMIVFPDQGDPDLITISQDLLYLPQELEPDGIWEQLELINSSQKGYRFVAPFLGHESAPLNRAVQIINDIEVDSEENLIQKLPRAVEETIRAASYFVNVQSMDFK